MNSNYVSKIEIRKLWGGKPIVLNLHKDVNIVIGPNASGKTTIINLLMFVLTGDVIRLSDYDFETIRVTLRAFEDDKQRIVEVSKSPEEISFDVGGSQIGTFTFPVSMSLLKGGLSTLPPHIFKRHFGTELFGLKQELEGLVPAAWLPVSRRLPVNEEDEDQMMSRKRGSLESVDECLSELLSGLQRYRLSLDAKLAELRKEFQRHALENILYDKSHDRGHSWDKIQAPTQQEKIQLIKAFQDVGFVDGKQMTARVEEHFKAAQEAVEQIKENNGRITSQTLFIIPLIHRTKQMVKFAQELEQDRQFLFAPLSLYETTISSFITDKDLSVGHRGDLRLKRKVKPFKDIEWRQLSSGEKQVLILLTQALLWEKNPVVYVADEPELSLHVIWQEQLVQSITSLAGQCQVIVATHSPDVAGGFPDKIIDLGRL